MLPLFGEQKQKILNDIAIAMREIGYKGDLLVNNWEYTDVFNTTKRNTTGIIELAGYARTPQDYRNACIAVATSNGKAGAELVAKHRSVGAPLFFEINNENITRWKVTEKGEPELKEIIKHTEIVSAFNYNSETWKPERIFRAKIEGDFEDVTQLDFFDVGLLPLLEGMIHKKLDKLLKEVLSTMVSIYEESNVALNKQYYQEIYRIIFRLIVAKVMQDRKHQITSNSSAVFILKAIERYYNPQNQVEIESNFKQKLVEAAWERISNGFQFQNLSVDDLAFVYESSLVTNETRELFGTHSTPPRIAEYIIRKLPFEEVPINDRFILEPCAGHGGFLVPALRRLRELLPVSFTDAQRHAYLTERLTGIETDSFAVEACWSRLVLADYPQQNGWNLIEKDVFEDGVLLNETNRAKIVFCNPPFEDFNAEQKKYYKNFHSKLLIQKPAEILNQVLQAPPSLLGFILPRRFESGTAYRQFHRQLAENYSRIELVATPEIFKFSDATTTLIMASGKREYRGSTTVFCRRVEESEKKSFLTSEFEPKVNKATFSSDNYIKNGFSLWMPPFSKIWSYLEQNPKFESISETHRGLEWKPRENSKIKDRKEISFNPVTGYKKGYAWVAKGAFKQYFIQHQVFLSMLPDDQSVNNYKFDWDAPKIVFNAARLSRNAWRLASIVDKDGVVFSKNFFASWIKEGISLYSVAAILNSPIANAFVFAFADGKHNHAKIIKSIPLPQISALAVDREIDKLSRELHNEIEQNNLNFAEEILLQIDAEILKEYDLPPYLEKEILSIFQNISRPVPFEFHGYYPEGFTANLPLHEIISPEFKEAQNTSLFDRINLVDDEQISEAMAYIRGELTNEDISS